MNGLRKLAGSLLLGLMVLAISSTEVDAQNKDKPSSSKPPSSSSGSSAKPPSSSPPPKAAEQPKPPPSPPPAAPKVDPPKPKFGPVPSTPTPPKEEPKKEEPKKVDPPTPKFGPVPAPPKKEEPKKEEPKAEQPKPKFGPVTPTPPKEEPKKADPPQPAPKFGPTTPASPKVEVKDSGKPKTDPLSDKARANKEARSERKYEESVKATQPPKPTYKTPDGKEEKIRTDSKVTEQIRNQPSQIVQPEYRQKVTVEHVHTYRYPHTYDYYRSQPVVYVGGGYSSAFWWMMMDWDAQRRAEWLYHNRENIRADAYQQGLRDAEVNRRIAEMEARRVTVNRDYVDPEFNKNPALMMDDQYIENVYNPKPVVYPTAPVSPQPSGPVDTSGVEYVFYVIGIILLIGVGVWFVTNVRWGK